MTGLVVDLFAGGGGASVGIEAARGRTVDIAINHDETALAVHRANHPATRHLEADIWEVRPREAVGGRPVELLWASPAECIDWSLPCPSIFERRKPLAEKTLWRIAQGIKRFVLEAPAPFIVHVNHGGRDARTAPLDAPLSTVTATQRGHALVAPTLIQTGYGERPGQAARVPGLHKPLGTAVNGQKHALVAAFLAKHFGGVVGQQLEVPASTVTAKDHHGLVAASLVKFRGTAKGHPGCAPVQLPLPTITAGGMHVAEVRAFLTTFYSSGSVGQKADKPLRTVTAKHRLGLVTIEGTDYQIVDIGMRMLEPHELLRAQFGRFAEGYDLSAARTKSAKVRLIGNSVCPEVAEAVIREQFTQGELEATA